MINLHWADLNLKVLLTDLDIVNQAKIDGSNNQPTANDSNPSPTETSITNKVKVHYSNEVKRSQDKLTPQEQVIDDCNDLTEANGHTQLFNRTKAAWDNKFQEFVLRLNHAKANHLASIEAINKFRIQENIQAGRTPKFRSTLKLVLSYLLLVAMAGSEIFMNTQLLKDVVGGGEGLTISTIVSFFNVVVSFLIARLCLTHIFNPVSFSSKKSLYVFLTSFGAITIIYINFMMGVYRGLIEKANEAGDMAQYLILSQQAAVEAVFPFNNFDVITFQSSFLMVVGFSFAFISLLDGYFFDDPINGYGDKGRYEISSKKILDDLTKEGPQLIKLFEEDSRIELREKRNLRHNALNTWSDIINELDKAEAQFNSNFNPSIKLVLETAIETYRQKNITFRSDAAPASFTADIDIAFIQSFADNHSSIKYELKSDPERVSMKKEKADLINHEWASTDDIYTDFFKAERDKIYDLL
jgi:hypothetical protein